MEQLLLFPVFLPMAAAPVAYFMGRNQEEARDTFVRIVVTLELFLIASFLTNPLVGHTEVTAAGFAGMGITLRDGGFHSLMAVLTACAWFAATIFCKDYMAHQHKRNRFYFFWLLTLGATMGVFLSADFFTMFLFFEVMSFTSFVSVIHAEDDKAIRAGQTYLAVAVIGGLSALMGIFLLYHQLGTLRYEQLTQAAIQGDRTMLWVAGVLMLVGFGAKAGAFPLHIWLPTAHPAAPAPASAVLSGIMIKTGIFGILVLSTTLFSQDAAWGCLMAVMGGITMVLGAVLAVCSVDVKRIFACSSVSQIGFILVGVSMVVLLGEHNALAVDGTILHIVNHSLVKMVLFPVMGMIYLSAHSYHLNNLRGFGRGKPFLAAILAIPMLSLSGLPLLNGYVSKTLLHESLVEFLHTLPPGDFLFQILEWMFLLTGGLTLAYMLKVFCCLFGRTGPRRWPVGQYISGESSVILLCYAGAMVVLGLYPNQTMDQIAAMARSFLGGHGPEHAVQYFSWVNLKGGFISLGIGVALYLLVVRTLMMEHGRYVEVLPRRLSLEDRIYRPALTFLAQVVVAAATIVDCLPAKLMGQWLPGLAERLQKGWSAFNDWLTRMTKGQYAPHPSVEQAADDYHFAFYDDQPAKPVGFTHSLAFGLLLTGLGLVFGLLFVLLQG